MCRSSDPELLTLSPSAITSYFSTNHGRWPQLLMPGPHQSLRPPPIIVIHFFKESTASKKPAAWTLYWCKRWCIQSFVKIVIHELALIWILMRQRREAERQSFVEDKKVNCTPGPQTCSEVRDLECNLLKTKCDIITKHSYEAINRDVSHLFL